MLSLIKFDTTKRMTLEEHKAGKAWRQFNQRTIVRGPRVMCRVAFPPSATLCNVDLFLEKVNAELYVIFSILCSRKEVPALYFSVLLSN